MAVREQRANLLVGRIGGGFHASLDRVHHARIERYKSIFAENGRLELISIDDASPTTLTITVNGGQGSTLSMEFVATATDPPRLTSLRLNMTR